MKRVLSLHERLEGARYLRDYKRSAEGTPQRRCRSYSVRVPASDHDNIAMRAYHLASLGTAVGSSLM